MENIVYGQIYAIYCKISGKYYVGKTLDGAEHRFKEHIADSTKTRNKNRPLYAAMNKYGVENFTLLILEDKCPKDILNEKERQWILKMNCFGHGYNATKGGDGKFSVDYDSIIRSYNEHKTVKGVVEELGVDAKTVKKVLNNAGIVITSSQDINKLHHGQKVDLLDVEGNVLESFLSLGDAADYVIAEGNCKPKNKRGCAQKIKLTCKGERRTSYTHRWQWSEN